MFQAILNSRISALLFCVVLAACGSSGEESEVTTQTGSNSSSPSPAPPVPTPVVGGVSEAQQDSVGRAVPVDATKARFNRPLGIALDDHGNVYVADAGNATIRKIAVSGAVTTLAGSPGESGHADGSGHAARFRFLKGIAVDEAGNVYAVDDSAIRKITPSGVVTTLAGTPGIIGSADGAGAAAQFNRPWGIAADKVGNLYVADNENCLVRKITPAGVVTTLAGTRGMRGTADGTGASATFLGPQGIAIDSTGNLYLTDWFGPPAPNIPEGSTFIRKIAANGAVNTLAGNFNSEIGPALFRDTFAIAADSAGNVYLAAERSVRKVSSTGIVSTVVGPTARFDALEGIAIDDAGNLYVSDTSAHAIDKVTQGGNITLYAGKPGEAGSVDVP